MRKGDAVSYAAWEGKEMQLTTYYSTTMGVVLVLPGE